MKQRNHNLPFSLEYDPSCDDAIRIPRLKMLRRKLIQAKYIHPKTRINSFINIFSNKSKTTTIDWIATLQELRYFIIQSIEEGKITKISHKWVVVAECFTLNGKPITEHQLRNQHPPLQYKKHSINILIKRLPTGSAFKENEC